MITSKFFRMGVCRPGFVAIFAALLAVLVVGASGVPWQFPAEAQSTALTPLLAKDQPVDWWFVFKFNTANFPGCGADAERSCPFGGEVQTYAFSQQYVYASSAERTLQKGGGCVGATANDPLGATFGAAYNNAAFFVVWNDQFYDDPPITGCTKECGGPWGHSKGMLVWNDEGNGFVLQVTTPSWPAAGSKEFPRKDGNTLGCVANDDDIKVSQHFFALRLTKDDVVAVLQGLKNASVVTDPHNHQIANIGGPADIQLLVGSLGAKSTSKTATKTTLSTGVVLIAKPSRLNVPPWQMVSAMLGKVPLRAATWWTNPAIPSTTASATIECWDPSLGETGPVEIATTGQWEGTTLGLKGGPGPNFNHAKIAVSTSGDKHYAIFGDMNQQGALSGKCSSSQNGRGGLFFVVEDETLTKGIADLIKGDTAPTKAPASSGTK